MLNQTFDTNKIHLRIPRKELSGFDLNENSNNICAAVAACRRYFLPAKPSLDPCRRSKKLKICILIRAARLSLFVTEVWH